MALLTAYLAHTARRKTGRTTISATRSLFERIATLIQATGQALSEAQELRRTMTHKYPFIDI